ncbi:hypothetical protein [Emticicia sp. TH156]|uniref:hypothetical protein n=1 Tax=Emticicia sp. TH156 TaxID=2067454 RepID=UPI000C77108D|nr:hypothetical protein [Emticicia sp. TH156]PLK44974.1 hypothetical protein C0V77_06930 [Emticicia sp. TH156]
MKHINPNYLNKIIALNRRQYLENAQSYGLAILAITLCLSLFFFICWHWRQSFSGGIGNSIFLIGLFGGGLAFSGFLYKDLGHSSKVIWFLGMPASASQKIIIFIIHSILFYALGYTIIFLVIEGFFYLLATGEQAKDLKAGIFKNGFYSCYLIFANFQLWLLIGNLTFRKAALVKTLLLIILSFIVASTGNAALMKIMSGEASITSSMSFEYFQFVYQEENIYVYLPETIQGIIFILSLLLPLFLSFIAYLKLTEKEV